MSKNREEWLGELAADIAFTLKTYKVTVPPYNISCGFPSRRALVDDPPVVEAWPADSTKDGVAQIYVNPRITDTATIVVGLHEALVMMALGETKKNNKDVVKKLKETAQEVGEFANTTFKRIGSYPQGELVYEKKVKKQTTRMRKLSCCGFDEAHRHEQYVLRGSTKVINLGIPDCPICRFPLYAEPEEEEKFPQSDEDTAS